MFIGRRQQICMNEIYQKLSKIFKERFCLDILENWEEIQNEHLLGVKIGLEATELIYLYYDIEKEFGIIIPEEHIVNGKFITIDNIAHMIQAQLMEKESRAEILC